MTTWRIHLGYDDAHARARDSECCISIEQLRRLATSVLLRHAPQLGRMVSDTPQLHYNLPKVRQLQAEVAEIARQSHEQPIACLQFVCNKAIACEYDIFLLKSIAETG